MGQANRPEPKQIGPGVADTPHRNSGVVALFTDYGYQGPYVGQLKARLYDYTTRSQFRLPPVIDLMHDAPVFNPRSSAYLLASCLPYLPDNSVVLAVVDPGVGTQRFGLALEVMDRWLVGPDNGLLAIAAKRFSSAQVYQLAEPAGISATFHGRDVFADVAAELAMRKFALSAGVFVGQAGAVADDALADDDATRAPSAKAGQGSSGNSPVEQMAPLNLGSIVGSDWLEDLDEIVYQDAFGNLHTGRRAVTVEESASMQIAGKIIPPARKFADVPPGGLFWYENSMGMVEVAANCHSAGQILNQNGTIGTTIVWINEERGR